jgi:hypothetical protein
MEMIIQTATIFIVFKAKVPSLVRNTIFSDYFATTVNLVHMAVNTAREPGHQR